MVPGRLVEAPVGFGVLRSDPPFPFDLPAPAPLSFSGFLALALASGLAVADFGSAVALLFALETTSFPLVAFAASTAGGSMTTGFCAFRLSSLAGGFVAGLADVFAPALAPELLAAWATGLAASLGAALAGFLGSGLLLRAEEAELALPVGFFWGIVD